MCMSSNYSGHKSHQITPAKQLVVVVVECADCYVGGEIGTMNEMISTGSLEIAHVAVVVGMFGINHIRECGSRLHDQCEFSFVEWGLV